MLLILRLILPITRLCFSKCILSFSAYDYAYVLLMMLSIMLIIIIIVGIAVGAITGITIGLCFTIA